MELRVLDGSWRASTKGRTAGTEPAGGSTPEGRRRPATSTATFHDLRHFYASLLIANGCSVKAVQKRLGHQSAMETLDTYGHLWPDRDDETREAVDLVLGSLSATG
jgi:integrase